MTSSAASLHKVLHEVRSQGPVTISRAWATVLRSEYGGTEFCRRHGEVAALLIDTLRAIDVLPGATKVRLAAYSTAWWRAITYPTGSWLSEQHRAAAIIKDDALDQLASAAELIESRFALSAIVPSSEATLEQLRVVCIQWTTLLDQTLELPESLRSALKLQIAHILWLIDNQHIFGKARAVAEGQSLSGALVQASAYLSDDASTGSQRRQGWSTGFKNLTIAIGAATSLLVGSAGVLEKVDENITTVTSIVEHVRELPGTIMGEPSSTDESDFSSHDSAGTGQ